MVYAPHVLLVGLEPIHAQKMSMPMYLNVEPFSHHKDNRANGLHGGFFSSFWHFSSDFLW